MIKRSGKKVVLAYSTFGMSRAHGVSQSYMLNVRDQDPRELVSDGDCCTSWDSSNNCDGHNPTGHHYHYWGCGYRAAPSGLSPMSAGLENIPIDSGYLIPEPPDNIKNMNYSNYLAEKYATDNGVPIEDAIEAVEGIIPSLSNDCDNGETYPNVGMGDWQERKQGREYALYEVSSPPVGSSNHRDYLDKQVTITLKGRDWPEDLAAEHSAFFHVESDDLFNGMRFTMEKGNYANDEGLKWFENKGILQIFKDETKYGSGNILFMKSLNTEEAIPSWYYNDGKVYDTEQAFLIVNGDEVYRDVIDAMSELLEDKIATTPNSSDHLIATYFYLP